jgi:MFS family permease
VLVITQTLAMVQAFILAALVLSGHIQVWHIVALSLCLGFINSFDFPMRQSFMIEMLEDKDDLSNAIALNSSMVNSARLIGPSIAGVVIAAVGEGVCFLLNGLSYIGVILALVAMRIPRKPEHVGDKNVLRGMKAGVRYAFSSTSIRSILILLAFISLIGFSYSSLLPIFARDILHGDSRTLGFLMAATGIGALVGAVYMAARKNALGLGRVLAAASGLLGAGLILMSLSHVVWLSLIVMFLVGLGMILQISSCNTILQTVVDEDKRGRVVSLYIVAFTGVVPYGNLLAGSVASAIGAPHTLLINGTLCIIASVVFALHLPKWRRHVRPIYISKGLLPKPPMVTSVE